MYSIGIDLGGTNIAVGIVDENYKIVKKGSCPTLAQRPAEEIVRDMVTLCKRLCEETGSDIRDLHGTGIACPGTVNPDTGIVEYANNIKFFDFPLVELFSKYSGIEKSKIKIGNDANLAAFGEAVAGAARGTSSSVTITLGTGVGSGIIIDGKMLTGCAHGGAEIGHTVIVKDGRPCTCGGEGCYEQYASAKALTQTVEKATGEKLNGFEIFSKENFENPEIRHIIDIWIDEIILGLKSIIYTFDPQLIVLGGGIMREEYIIELIDRKIYKELMDNYRKVKIVNSDLGNDAGMLGAAFEASKL